MRGFIAGYLKDGPIIWGHTFSMWLTQAREATIVTPVPNPTPINIVNLNPLKTQ